MFMHVNDVDQKVRIARERKDIDIAADLSPIMRSVRESREVETNEESQENIRSLRLFSGGKYSLGENDRERSSFQRKSEALYHVLADTATKEPIPNTLVKKPGSVQWETSSVVGDAFEHNINKARRKTSTAEVKKPAASTMHVSPAVDGISRSRTVNVKRKMKQAGGDFTLPRRNVIIVAQPRSGSSFLGDAFNQNPDVFYLFEPLHGVMNNALQYIDGTNPTEFLAGILRCNFNCTKCVEGIGKFPRFFSNALSSPPLCATKTYFHTPKKKCDTLTTSNMEKVCTINYNITVMKILSTRIPENKVKSLFPLCSSTSCTIIYLVRDPRAVIFSHMKVGIRNWNYFKTPSKDSTPRPAVIKSYSAQVCRQIEANVKAILKFTGQKNNRYYLLRYEDLARSPVETFQRVFEITGVTMQNSTLQWIRDNTSGDKTSIEDEESPLSTNRNSKGHINKWRLEVDPCLVNIIEDSCRSVMRLLGYKLLNRSEEMQYDLTVSLYDNNLIP